MYRTPMTEDEAQEAMCCILLAFGYRRSLALLEAAQDQLRKETEEGDPGD